MFFVLFFTCSSLERPHLVAVSLPLNSACDLPILGSQNAQLVSDSSMSSSSEYCPRDDHSENDDRSDEDRVRLSSNTSIDELIIHAIETIGSSQGCSRNQIADFLVRRGLIESRISRARVQKALYKAVREGVVYRPGGSLLYRVKRRARRVKVSVKRHRQERHHNRTCRRRRSQIADSRRRDYEQGRRHAPDPNIQTGYAEYLETE